MKYTGRPTLLYFAERLTERIGGAKIYLKREDLCHTGAHKINNTLGQVLLARKMNKPRIIARNRCRAAWRGHGDRHGLVWSSVRCLHGFGRRAASGTERFSHAFARRECDRRAVGVGNAKRRDQRGRCAIGLRTSRRRTIWSDRRWGRIRIPRWCEIFNPVIGLEVREQMMAAEGRLPDLLVACVGGR